MAGIDHATATEPAEALLSPLKTATERVSRIKVGALPCHDLTQPLVDVARVDVARREVLARQDALQERDIVLHTLDGDSLSASRIV